MCIKQHIYQQQHFYRSILTTFVHGTLYSLQNMASLHSSPWTPYKIHVGHSPRNDSVPDVCVFRSLYEVIVNIFSKGSATQYVSVTERRALFRKMFVSLSFWCLLCVWYFAQQRIPLLRTTCITFVPLSFSTVTSWFALTHTRTHNRMHTVVFIGVAPFVLVYKQNTLNRKNLTKFQILSLCVLI